MLFSSFWNTCIERLKCRTCCTSSIRGIHFYNDLYGLNNQIMLQRHVIYFFLKEVWNWTAFHSFCTLMKPPLNTIVFDASFCIIFSDVISSIGPKFLNSAQYEMFKRHFLHIRWCYISDKYQHLETTFACLSFKSG